MYIYIRLISPICLIQFTLIKSSLHLPMYISDLIIYFQPDVSIECVCSIPHTFQNRFF